MPHRLVPVGHNVWGCGLVGFGSGGETENLDGDDNTDGEENSHKGASDCVGKDGVGVHNALLVFAVLVGGFWYLVYTSRGCPARIVLKNFVWVWGVAGLPSLCVYWVLFLLLLLSKDSF